MKFIEWRKEADFFTGKLSDINRQLALAGIAIVWIFRSTKEGNIIPDQLEVVLYYLVWSLILDIIQYLYGSIVWSVYVRWYDHKKTKDDTNLEPHWLWKVPTYIPLLLKVYFLGCGYYLLLLFLYDKL